MDSIKKSVTCQICQRLFKNPVYLPCSNTVCLEHVDEILKSKNDNSTNDNAPCLLCKNSHSLTLLSNLKINQTALDIIKSNSYLSDLEKKLKSRSSLFSEELNNLFQKCMSRIETDLELFLIDYHTNIRNQIELQRKLLIDKINKKANGLIDKVNSVEEKHKKTLTKMRQDEKLNKKLESLNKFKIDLDAEFRQPYLHQAHLDDLNEQMKARITSFKEKLNDIEEFRREIKCLNFEPCHVMNTTYEAFGEILDIDKLNKIVSCSNDATIKIWDLNAGVCVHSLEKHSDSVNQIESISEYELASCSLDGSIKIWNYLTGK